MFRRVLALLVSTVYATTLHGGSMQPIDAASRDVLVFPTSLETVEEEAFSQTAANTLVFHEKLIYIGSEAFGSTRLRHVYIQSPRAVITDSAFAAESGLTMHAAAESTACQWAENHNLPFIADNGLARLAGGGASPPDEAGPADRMILTGPDREQQDGEDTTDRDRSMRPQDRPELYPIDYRFP